MSRMSPLSLPSWEKDSASSKPRFVPKSFADPSAPAAPAQPNTAPQFLGKRNEHLREAVEAKQTIIIEVLAVKGLQSGQVKVAYVEGQPLSGYLEPLSLKAIALRTAVYDMTNLEKGRLRHYYIPQPNAVIRLCSANMGVRMDEQRVRGDGMNLAFNMKGKQVGDAMNVAEFDMRYRPAEAPVPAPPTLDDELGIDQF